ncbi:MAG: 4-(cytidine 5'-diphospho)-2-C-methyl-D-erythritol kinase [Oscillospiraceae bacterium]|nr:4-(cytidine 5'-diphospho)-2-C-methyl-D-erythritol kinase [Oscillospiraceae bacterium]
MKLNVKAYAKLNFFIDILGRREDGYHEILTTMCLIDLADDAEISISAGDCIKLVCSDPNIPADERNTAYKAASLFLERLGVRRQITIEIIKKIPAMAGLGSSSTDAAAVLRGLNELLGKPFSLKQLLEMGAEIGSDVPFCIYGGFALCGGRGTEIIETYPLPGCVFVVVKPGFECSSKKAYGIYAANPIPRAEFKDYYNIFEALYNNPEIARIKQELADLGASAASLTGSGSAVFGVFADMKAAEKAFLRLNYTEKFITKPVLDKLY